MITLTPAAEQHFQELIAKEQDAENLNLRLNVVNPGTQQADVGIVFCPFGDEDPADLELHFAKFSLYIEHESIPALREAVIDFNKDQFGGQLSVKAPYIRGVVPGADAPLLERVQYIIDNEINPGLASHRGHVRLVEITANNTVVLRFGGGCHGCGMADITLKTGIEKTLLQQCPEITGVIDVTDHTAGENPYYRAPETKESTCNT